MTIKESKPTEMSVDEDTNLAGVTAENLAGETDGVEGLAGRELDAAVAERVMGFHRHHSGVLLPNDDRLHLWYDDAMNAEAAKGELWLRVPRYSTDIAAAMEVVEKLANRFSFGCWRSRNDSELSWTWRIKFQPSILAPEPHQSKTQGMYYFAEATTLPEAICRAVLQAVSEQKG